MRQKHVNLFRNWALSIWLPTQQTIKQLLREGAPWCLCTGPTPNGILLSALAAPLASCLLFNVVATWLSLLPNKTCRTKRVILSMASQGTPKLARFINCCKVIYKVQSSVCFKVIDSKIISIIIDVQLSKNSQCKWFSNSVLVLKGALHTVVVISKVLPSENLARVTEVLYIISFDRPVGLASGSNYLERFPLFWFLSFHRCYFAPLNNSKLKGPTHVGVMH